MRLLDPRGWMFYGEHCEDKMEARLAEERSPLSGEQYVELLCSVCDSVLLDCPKLKRG